MNIYIGNFSGDVTDEDLKQAFEAFGKVESATVVKDKYTGESRGFGFVEILSKKSAADAMDGIRELKGRMVTVNEARPRFERGSGGRGKRSMGGRQSRGGRY